MVIFINYCVMCAIIFVYKGESNTGYRRDQYNCSFRAMIEDWRTKFNTYSFAQTSSAFPFGFIQVNKLSP